MVQFWSFKRLGYHFLVCLSILGGLEVHWMTFSVCLKGRSKSCQISLHALILWTQNQILEPLNVNFFDFFWHFPTQLIQRNGKTPLEGSKVEKLEKWATLTVSFLFLLVQKTPARSQSTIHLSIHHIQSSNVMLLNKVSGLWLWNKMCLASNPPNLKILPQTKFHPIWTTGSKVMAINFRICEISKIGN